MALGDFIIGGASTPSAAALPVPQTPRLADIAVSLPAAPQRAPKSERIRNTVGTILDLIAGAGGRVGDGYWANKERLQKENEARQAQETARMQAEAQQMRRDNALAAYGQDPANRAALIEMVGAGVPGALDLNKALNPQAAAVSPSGDIQMLDRLTSILGSPQAALDYLARLKLPPQALQVPNASGGRDVFQVDRAPQTGGELFARMVQQESGGRQFGADGQPLTSRAGAIGIAQVMPGTAPEAARLAGVPFDDNAYRTDPAYNRRIGEAYFNEQLRRFGDPARAAAAYNAGPGAVQSAIQRGGENWLSLLPRETQDYVASVMSPQSGGARRVASTQGKPTAFRAATPQEAAQYGVAAGQFGPDGKFYATGATGKGGAPKAGDALKPGQLADIDNMISVLMEAEQRINKGGVSGPITGLQPAWMRNFTNPDSVNVQELVASVTQRNLKEILGGQFARAEGEQLINRAYNPGLSENLNLPRVMRLRKAIEARRAELAGGGAPVRVASPAEAQKLAPGTQFITPDGQVRIRN